MKSSLFGKNKKPFKVGMILLLTSAMIIFLFIGAVIAIDDETPIKRLSGADRWATSAVR